MLESEIRFLPLGARRVAYEMRGGGPPLVAPAWWVSHLELDWQSAGFRRFWEGVADGYAFIRYDRLGVGMSDRTLRDSDLTIDEEVATLRALLDELELERVSLVGGSCGSCTAIAFAATYPERVERLVLYGSYPDGAEITAPGVADAILGAVRAHWGLGSRLLSDMFLGGAEKQQMQPNQEATEPGLPLPSTLTWSAEELASLRYGVDWGATDYTSDPDWVRGPVLIMHGTRDDTVPVATSEELSHKSSDVTLDEVRGANHVESWNVDPEAYDQTVTDFLERTTG